MVRASGEIVRGCVDGGGGAGADSALFSRRRCIRRVSWRRVDALSAGRAAGAVDAAAGTTDGGGASAAEKVRRRRFVGRSSRLGVRMDDGQRRHLPAPAVRLRHPLRRHSIGGAGASIGRHRAEAPPSGGLGQAQADSGLPGQARAGPGRPGRPRPGMEPVGIGMNAAPTLPLWLCGEPLGGAPSLRGHRVGNTRGG